MTGTAVCDFSCASIEPRQEHRGQRKSQTTEQQVAIDRRQDSCGILQRLDLQAHQPHDVREPHGGREALACDVPDREYEIAAVFKHAGEIAGKVTHRKNLTRNLVGPAAKQARTTELSLLLGSLVHGTSQTVVVPTDSRQLVREQAGARCAAASWVAEGFRRTSCQAANLRSVLRIHLQTACDQPTNL